MPSSDLLDKWYLYYTRQKAFVKYEELGIKCDEHLESWEFVRWEVDLLLQAQEYPFYTFLLSETCNLGARELLRKRHCELKMSERLKVVGKNNKQYLVAYSTGENGLAYGVVTLEEVRKLLEKPGWHQQTKKAKKSGNTSMFYVRDMNCPRSSAWWSGMITGVGGG